MTLFSQLAIRDVQLKNRIVVSPMCQYSSVDGMPNSWHLAHLGALAIGGSGLVFTEAAAITPEGRISPQDLGIYSDDHAAALKQVTDFIKSQGAVPGIQLAHAGRKASTYRPWAPEHGEVPLEQGGWKTIGPTAAKFSDSYPMPHELSSSEIQKNIRDWGIAAERAVNAGFEVVEIHAAHGYLGHQFLSALSNHRSDSYGGSFENRTRFVIEMAEEVRHAIPKGMPLFIRVSATDWTVGGVTIEDTVKLAKLLLEVGVDLVDVSTGGNVPNAKIPIGPGYQVPFASQIRQEVGIMTGAVGMITEPAQANAIIESDQADLVFLARELLRNPLWPAKAAKELGFDGQVIPNQYVRAW